MPRLPMVLLLLAAACAPAPPETAPAPAADPAAAAMPAPGIVGEYTTTLAAADLPAAMPDSVRNDLIGTWRIALHDGGHFVVTYDGRQVVEGTYRVEGNRITFPVEDTGDYACHMPATYTWETTGGRLAFTRVEDACEGRVIVLTTRPLSRG